MSNTSPQLTPHNTTEPPPTSYQTFSITARPNTDIYRSPTHPSVFSAPLLHATLPLSSFRRARVSFSAPWSKTYDQGGLCIVLVPRHPTQNWKWVKAGIEFVHNRAQISVVACDRWADWSLSPLPYAEGGSLTIEFAREVKQGGVLGSGLLVYAVEGVERKVVRDVTWIFGEEEDVGVKEIWVGPFAARPGNEGGELEVKFGHLVIESE